MKGHQDSVKGTREACVIFRSHGLSHFPSVNPDRRDRLQREKRTLFDSYFEGSTPRGCLESAQEMHFLIIIIILIIIYYKDSYYKDITVEFV
jgi:hypothetical protein